MTDMVIRGKEFVSFRSRNVKHSCIWLSNQLL